MRLITTLVALATASSIAACAPPAPKADSQAAEAKPEFKFEPPEKTARQEYEEGPKYDFSELGASPRRAQGDSAVTKPTETKSE